MFADSFCDSGWSNRSRRGWTTLGSFALQALVVGCLLTLPLLYTQGLPRLTLLAPQLLAPAPPPIAGSAITHRVLCRPKQHDGNQARQPFPDSPDCKHADGNGAATANGRSKRDRDQPWNR